MNVTMRKLAMLEENMQKIEERSKMEGSVTSPVDRDFQARVTALMDRVRAI